MNMIQKFLLLNELFIVKCILYIFLIFSSAFFAGIETALLRYSVVRTQIKDSLKSYINIWEKIPEVVLSAILVGTNIACVGIGILNESLNLQLGISMILLLIFGEILPKMYALKYPQKFINFGIKKLIIFGNIVSPIAKFLTNISLYFTGIFLREPKEPPFLTKQEFAEFIYSDGFVSKDENIMYLNILKLAEKRVEDVMIPKDGIVGVDINWTVEEIIEKLKNIKYSRVPVYDKTLDNIVGVIYTKDIVLMARNKKLFVINDLIRDTYFVINKAYVIDVLKKFKQGQHHLAIVVDEYGSTLGLITIEDIIEEVIGEIYDEYDIKTQKIKMIDKNTIIAYGDESIKNIEEKLNVKFSQEDVTTIGGYVCIKLGYVPKIGDKINLDNLQIEVLDATKKVIKMLKIVKI